MGKREEAIAENNNVWQNRGKFASLWISQVGRVLADWSLRFAAMLEWTRRANESLTSAGNLATVVFITPSIVLAPLTGCISNSLPRRWVLAGSAAFTLVSVGLFHLTPWPWLVCLGVVGVGAALYNPTRFAMLPAAADDTAVPLPRLNSWIELGNAASILGGILLGWCLGQLLTGQQGRPVAWPLLAALLGLNLLCFVAALPTSFPSDRPRPEAPLTAVKDFFVDCGRVAREPEACGTLLGLASVQAIMTAGGIALMAQSTDGGPGMEMMMGILLLVGGGSALGSAAAGVQKHPRRNLGLVPPAAAGLLLTLAWVGVEFMNTPKMSTVPWLPCLLLGIMGGLVNVPLRSAYLGAVPADARGNATSVMNTVIYVVTALLSALLVGLARAHLLVTPAEQLGFLAALAAVGTILAFVLLMRATLENILDLALWPVYRLHVYGPGVGQLPPHGPLLLVVNHSSYVDPVWVGQVVPRFIHPMMTSLFYDVPVLRWWLAHVFQVIRVEATPFRHEAPELAEAVAMLKRGRYVLIFPEAMLRRTDEQLLRPFGQGVWHILREVPETPVVTLWIEGGWGSFFSYKNGLPGKNKRFDWWRRISIAIGEVRPVPAAILADRRTTREYLRQTCLECRRYIGLDVPGETTDKKNPAATDTPS